MGEAKQKNRAFEEMTGEELRQELTRLVENAIGKHLVPLVDQIVQKRLEQFMEVLARQAQQDASRQQAQRIITP